MVHATKTAGPKGYKPASGYMYKRNKTTKKLTIHQVFKPYAKSIINKIKGGKQARVIRSSSGRLIHVTEAKKRGWKRVMIR